MISKYNNYLSDQEKEFIVQMYNKGCNTVEIANRLGRNNSSIGRYLRKCNLPAHYNKCKLRTSDKERIIELYKSGKTAKEILPLFLDKVKTENTIMSIVKNAGINRGRGVVSDADKDYFEVIDTECKAYFLGLFLADGNVHKCKRKTEQYVVQICLQSKDKYMLEKFKNEIHSSNKIRYCVSNNEYNFGVSSSKMAHDLINKGVVPCKSLKAELFYDIPKDLFRHYIRGLFDGNGTVYFTKTKSGKEILRFGLYGTHKIVMQFQDWLVQQIGLTPLKVFDKPTVSFVTYQRKNDIQNFCNLIYDNSTIYLKRKKEKFDCFLSQ